MTVALQVAAARPSQPRPQREEQEIRFFSICVLHSRRTVTVTAFSAANPMMRSMAAFPDQLESFKLTSLMTARSKLRRQKKEAASSFCPFAPVESLLVAKVSIGERRCRSGSHVTTACPRQGSNPGLPRLES